MFSKPRWSLIAILGLGMTAAAVSATWLNADEEQERQITEKEVPKPALDALRKLAAGAPLTNFSEEKEHGQTYYEGSWKGEHGHIDALVTPTGDVVEIEEGTSSDRVPQAVLAAAQKQAGPGATLRFEKKTQIFYEIKFKKGDRFHEVLLTPDGRTVEHEQKAKDED